MTTSRWRAICRMAAWIPPSASGGKVTTDFGGLKSRPALVLQPDGKLVAAGSIPGVRLSTSRWRVTSRMGSLDLTFGVGGKVTTDFAGD